MVMRLTIEIYLSLGRGCIISWRALKPIQHKGLRVFPKELKVYLIEGSEILLAREGSVIPLRVKCKKYPKK